MAASREANLNQDMKICENKSKDELDKVRETMDKLFLELQKEKAKKTCSSCQNGNNNEENILDLLDPSMDSIVRKNELFQDFSLYYARKLETEQLQCKKLHNQNERLENYIMKLESEKEMLKNQVKMLKSPNESFEKFYVQELEAKLEAHRKNESKLVNDLEIAKVIVKDLQMENKEFLNRERKLLNEFEILQDQATNSNDISG